MEGTGELETTSNFVNIWFLKCLLWKVEDDWYLLSNTPRKKTKESDWILNDKRCYFLVE